MLNQFNLTFAEPKGREGHRVRSRITTIIAETNLAPSPQLGIPETITGKLTPSLTPEQLFQLNFKPDVEVGFEGRGYRFSKLEKDGTFELSRIHP